MDSRSSAARSSLVCRSSAARLPLVLARLLLDLVGDGPVIGVVPFSGLPERAQREAGADRLQMLLWFFETRLDRDMPDDLESFASSLGLAGRDALYDLIEAEFVYCHSDVGSTAPDG